MNGRGSRTFCVRDRGLCGGNHRPATVAVSKGGGPSTCKSSSSPDTVAWSEGSGEENRYPPNGLLQMDWQPRSDRGDRAGVKFLGVHRSPSWLTERDYHHRVLVPFHHGLLIAGSDEIGLHQLESQHLRSQAQETLTSCVRVRHRVNEH